MYIVWVSHPWTLAQVSHLWACQQGNEYCNEHLVIVDASSWMLAQVSHLWVCQQGNEYCNEYLIIIVCVLSGCLILGCQPRCLTCGCSHNIMCIDSFVSYTCLIQWHICIHYHYGIQILYYYRDINSFLGILIARV